MTKKEIEKILISKILENPHFIRFDKAPAVYPEHNEHAGLLWKIFYLFETRTWTRLSRENDGLILSVLDKIAKEGKAKFFSVELTKDMHHDDIRFRCEIGTAKRTNGTCDVKQTTIRLYSDEPLTKKEKKEPYTILNVKEQFEKIREERDKAFRKEFGWRYDFDLEKKLRNQELKAQSELRRNIRAIRKWTQEHDEKQKKA